MTDDDRAEAIAAHRARHELQRHGLRDSEVGLTVASLTHAYKDDSAKLLALVRALDSEEPLTTEDVLVHTMTTVASSSRRIAATMRRTLKDLAREDPRRFALNEAAMSLDMTATSLEQGLVSAGERVAA